MTTVEKMTAPRTFDLSKYRDLDVKSLMMRSINGEDTLDAATRCIPPDGTQIDGNIFNVIMRQQITAQAITGYVDLNGVSTVSSGPCLESLRWNSRTREFIGEIFDHMNGVSSDEREDFRKALVQSTPGSPGVTSADKT